MYPHCAGEYNTDKNYKQQMSSWLVERINRGSVLRIWFIFEFFYLKLKKANRIACVKPFYVNSLI